MQRLDKRIVGDRPQDELVKKHLYFSKANYRSLHFARDWPPLQLCADSRFVSLALSLCSLNLQKHAADREDKHRRASNKQAQMLSKIPTRGIMGDEHHIPAKFAPLSCGPCKRR
jgi:hypothetical protein